jgi:hypothetical protein
MLISYILYRSTVFEAATLIEEKRAVEEALWETNSIIFDVNSLRLINSTSIPCNL